MTTARAVALHYQRVVVLLRGWAPFIGILVAYDFGRVPRRAISIAAAAVHGTTAG